MLRCVIFQVVEGSGRKTDDVRRSNFDIRVKNKVVCLVKDNEFVILAVDNRSVDLLHLCQVVGSYVDTERLKHVKCGFLSFHEFMVCEKDTESLEFCIAQHANDHCPNAGFA